MLHCPVVLSIVLTQYLRYLGSGSRPYPNAANTFCLGLCTGSFAAAAFSVSKTPTELIDAGIEAVLVALRVALRSLKVRDDVTKAVQQTRQSWSVIVNLQEDEATSLIDSYSTAKVS